MHGILSPGNPAVWILELDLPVEYEIGGAGERDIAVTAGFLEADLQQVAPLDPDSDWLGCSGQFVQDQRTGHDSSSASEGLALDAALVGADGDGISIEHFHKVDVGPFRSEMLVISYRPAQPLDINRIELINNIYYMGHAGVDGMNVHAGAQDIEGIVQPQVPRCAHVDLHEVAGELSGDHAGKCFETHSSSRTREAVCVPGEAARPVAAHLGLAAIAVVITHLEIGAVARGLDHQQPVRAHAAMPVADALDRPCVEAQSASAVVHEHEIISGPVHFCKSQHRGSFSTGWRICHPPHQM